MFSNRDITEVRDYWNTRPCNIRHSSQTVGTREYFDEVEARKYFVEPHISGFAEFGRWQGGKVLEVGCGIGTDTINFARAGARVTAVDLSEESLNIARQRAEVYGLADRITFVQANAEKLTEYVPVESYDLIYSFGVLHHTPDPPAAIRQILRYMDRDSCFKMMVYNRISWKVLWMLLKYGKGAWWNLDRIIAENSEAQTGCPVTYCYTKRSIAGLLQGMAIEKIMIDHIFPYSIPEYTRYEYKKVLYFDIIGERMMQFLETRFGWHLCVEAKLAGCTSIFQ